MKVKSIITDTRNVHLFAGSELLGDYDIDTIKHYYGDYEIEYFYVKGGENFLNINGYKSNKTAKAVIEKIKDCSNKNIPALLTLKEMEILLNETNL